MEGWPGIVRNEMRKAHAVVCQMRSSRRWRDDLLGSSPRAPGSGFEPGEGYREYVWQRAQDGFWPFSEIHACADIGGSVDVLAEPSFWIDAEASILLFESHNAHRRSFEDDGRGVLSHIAGPAGGRVRWGFNHACDLWLSQGSHYETSLDRIVGTSADAAFWLCGLSIPGSPTWHNLVPVESAAPRSAGG
jgi:hypothetical protein